MIEGAAKSLGIVHGTVGSGKEKADHSGSGRFYFIVRGRLVSRRTKRFSPQHRASAKSNLAGNRLVG